MCEPTTIAMLTIAAAGAVTSHQQAKQSAETTADSIEESQRLAQETSLLRQQQYNKSAADEKAQRSIEALQERGRIRAIMGESGLGGNTQSRIEGESYFNQGADIASIEANRQAEIRQTQLEGQGVRADNQSKLNTIRRPSLVGTGLQIASAGLGAYGRHQAAKGKTKGA